MTTLKPFPLALQQPSGVVEGRSPVYRSRVEQFRIRSLGRLCLVRIGGLCLGVGLIALTGCGYSTMRPFPTDFRTIHVEMFQSREFRRELEFRLTEALQKRIEMDTPYRIAPRRTADVLVSGEILDVSTRTFGSDLDSDQPREIGTTITVRLRVKDLRDGRILVDRPKFVFQSTYIPPVGESFNQGMTRGLEGLAERIVQTLETPW